jgi:uncharacterized protein (DUF427 family)
MGIRQRNALMKGLPQLRYEPIEKRIRGAIDGQTVVDSTSVYLVWEPRRVVPSYAVPPHDIAGELLPAKMSHVDASVGAPLPDVTQLPVLDPKIPFAAHSTDGEASVIRVGNREIGAFRATDGDLGGRVLLDFDAFDEWYEEDQLNLAHPRDPFHRIDVVPSSRHVRLELDGKVLADSSRPMLLFETMLPARYYLPREDIAVDLQVSEKRTWCAYKGQASYWSPQVGEKIVPDLVWSYLEPLHDAEPVQGLLAFFTERVDLTLDGERRKRPITPWS